MYPKCNAGTPGIKGNPGHFAMKFINLRRPGSKPVFVVLPTENRKYTFYINTVKVRTENWRDCDSMSVVFRSI